MKVKQGVNHHQSPKHNRMFLAFSNEFKHTKWSVLSDKAFISTKILLSHHYSIMPSWLLINLVSVLSWNVVLVSQDSTIRCFVMDISTQSIAKQCHDVFLCRAICHMAYNKFTSKSGQNIKFDLRSNERWWADLILFIVIATVEVINVYLISEVKIRE